MRYAQPKPTEDLTANGDVTPGSGNLWKAYNAPNHRRGVLGYEREQSGKAAGVRTHMLVAMGAALFVLVPQMSGAQADAMSRVVQGVIAGIGFLGAGTILKGKDGDDSHVKGLTTAAGLWMTAAIGVAAGLGRESTAVLSTLLALAVFSVMPVIVRWLEKDEQ